MHLACQWGNALASIRSSNAVHTALKAELGPRAVRLDVGQVPAQDTVADEASAPWHGSWEAFIGVTREQLMAWASPAAEEVCIHLTGKLVQHPADACKLRSDRARLDNGDAAMALCC